MFKIKGKVNTAICYAKVVEPEAVEQIRRICDYELTENSRIRIMPDVHAGKGCTIGTTMTITDKVCPNIVGVDIGCGIYTVKLAEKELDFEKIDEICHYIPSGMHVWETPQKEFSLDKLRCYKALRNKERLCSLGTLGGGNHFIEIDQATDGVYYLIIHTGSRNLGKQVAEIYQNIAIDLYKGKDKYYEMRRELISSYKANGKQQEIQFALDSLAKEFEHHYSDAPEDLCWLEGKYLDDYLHDMKVCQRFAKKNREKIAEIILKKGGLTQVESFHTMHNYIDTQNMILRKGAIAARYNQKVLIPINMRDGSVLAIGIGNSEWNYSAPHGAGRIMSRSKARSSISLEEYKEAMKGIYTTSVNENTLDEAPMVYKSLDDIIDVIKESVIPINIMKPVYNFKASDDEVPWKKSEKDSNNQCDSTNQMNCF